MKDQDKSQWRFCTRCGEPVTSMQKFCRSCGYRLRSPEVEESGSQTITQDGASSDETTARTPVTAAGSENVRGEENFSYGDSARSSGVGLGERLHALKAWFRELPKTLKIALVGVGGIVAAVLLSPVSIALSVLLTVAALVFVVWMLFSRESLRLGGAVAVGIALVITLVLGGISDGVWGTGFPSFAGGSSDGQDPDVAASDAQYRSEPLYEEEEVDYSSLSSEETAYLDAAKDFDDRIRSLMDEQTEILSCYPGCNAEDMMAQGSNYEESNYVYSGVRELSVPEGYEDSHQSLVCATDAMFEFVRTDISAPDVSYAQENIDSTAYCLNESVDLLPSEAQGYYSDEAAS